MKKRGISLIVLVITIIVIAILAATVILLLFNNNTLDQSKKAKFMSDYRTVQEGVNLFSLGKYNAATNEFELPLKGYLTAEDKVDITNNVPTLKTKIEELSGTIDTVNLAWISSEDIGVKLSSEKAAKGYILDVAKGLIYDYNGDYFEGQMWHTLDGGVVSGGPGVPSLHCFSVEFGG
jgi:type II secretory pathway pseudopilin PulG